MSTAKRSHQRQAEAGGTTSLPPAKRAKISKEVQEHPSSLAFLTDERQRSGKTIQAVPTNGLENPRINHIDEQRATTTTTADPADVSQDEDEGEDNDAASSVVSSSSEEPSSDSESEDAEAEVEGAPEKPLTNGLDSAGEDGELEDEVMKDAGDNGVVAVNGHVGNDAGDSEVDRVIQEQKPSEDAAEAEAGGPSFGELLEQTHNDIIDVAAAFSEPGMPSKALTSTSDSKALQAPSANSLGTVLSQALRTNDKELLESCLQTKDIDSVKSTIQRLQSPLATTLMQKLAERLHKRPGRAGPLMVWIQWALVTHGSYLAGQPQMVRQLRELRQVIQERASSFQHLIILKGKLDMLGAQVELRRRIRTQRAHVDESDDEEADVVYVEGQEDDFSDSSEDDKHDSITMREVEDRSNSRIVVKPTEAITQGDVDTDGDIPLINGVDDDAEVESVAEVEENGIEEPEGYLDDEAEESEGEESMSSEEERSGSDSDMEEDAEDDISASDESESAPVPQRLRPAKRNALIRKR